LLGRQPQILAPHVLSQQALADRRGLLCWINPVINVLDFWWRLLQAAAAAA
jgi:hypothetical protein